MQGREQPRVVGAARSSTRRPGPRSQSRALTSLSLTRPEGGGDKCGKYRRKYRLRSKRNGDECLTCGARARSVGAREVVGRGSDVGRRVSRRRSAEGRPARGGRCRVTTGRTGRSEHGGGGTGRPGPVRGDSGRFWAVGGRSGPVCALGRSGPSGPVQADWAGSGPAGRPRWSGPVVTGPVWTGLDKVRRGCGLG